MLLFNILCILILDGSFCQTDFNTTVTVVTNLQLVPGFIYEKEFIFTCFFPNPNRDTLVYKSTWFVDDVIVYESTYSDYNDADKDRSLTDTRLKNGGITTLGFQLHCDINAAENTELKRPSIPSTSSKKFIGIKVYPSVIDIKEGEQSRIQIRSEVPIGCADDNDCTLTVTADIPAEDADQCEPTPTPYGVCGILIKTSEWNNFYRLNISSTVTEDYGQTVTQKKVFLRTDFFYRNQPIWGNYFLEPVTINIVKDTSLIEGKRCLFYGNLYLNDFYRKRLVVPVTFKKKTKNNSVVQNLIQKHGKIESNNCIVVDYSKEKYHQVFRKESSFELAGTFYLLQMDNVEVQVQIEDCTADGTGYCVCGVVVRVGRTAFMINHCNFGYWFIDYILCDDGGDILEVRKLDETGFEIYLPSGTKIYISLSERLNYNWLNIDIYPSVRDIGKTSGLCGELTDNPPVVNYNDAYFNSFRVQQSKYLFDPDNWKARPEWISNDIIGFQHCRCDGYELSTVVDCTPLPGATTCLSDTDQTLFQTKRCVSPLRKKRSLPQPQTQILQHIRLRRDVSWKNGWTMNSASEYCTGLFNNSMVIKRCDGIKGIDAQGAIDACVSDIKLSGTDAFALSSISSVSSQCIREASMNGTLREDKVENGKTILEMVKEVACPGECSGQGLCEDGKCICNSGYIGSDCSVSVNEPPVAHNLEADGHCDLLEDDCTEVAVFGGRFVDADQTKCKLLQFKMNNNEVILSQDPEIQTAVFESIGEVTCKLPARKRRRRSVDVPVIDETVTGYKVSVSNNGQNYSQQLNFIMYNTECMNCSTDNSGEMVCLFSSDHCIMDNICHDNGVVYNTGDREYVCRADSSGKSWLPVIVENSKDNGDDIDVVVIGISAAVVVVVVVVITIIIVCLVRKRIVSKKLSIVSPSATNPANGSTDRNHTIYDTTSLSKDNNHVYETFK